MMLEICQIRRNAASLIGDGGGRFALFPQIAVMVLLLSFERIKQAVFSQIGAMVSCTQIKSSGREELVVIPR